MWIRFVGGGRPCPPGALHIRNAKPFGEIVLPYGPTESSAPTRRWIGRECSRFRKFSFFSNINRKATQRSGRLSERKRKGANMKFSALAGNGMQRVSSDAAAVLFFLQKRKKRMGRKLCFLFWQRKGNGVAKRANASVLSAPRINSSQKGAFGCGNGRSSTTRCC